jgi:hypothetical protein
VHCSYFDLRWLSADPGSDFAESISAWQEPHFVRREPHFAWQDHELEEQLKRRG